MTQLEIIQYQNELYVQFRAYNNMSDEEKVTLKAKITQEEQKRPVIERENYHNAIQLNLVDIQQKLIKIEERLNSVAKGE